jgi:hypothetical protein
VQFLSPNAQAKLAPTIPAPTINTSNILLVTFEISFLNSPAINYGLKAETC